MRKRFLAQLIAGWAVTLWLAGCGGDDGQRDDQTEAEVTSEQTAVMTTLPGDSAAIPAGQSPGAADISFYTSSEGRFKIIWPPGCARVRTRAQVNHELEGEPITMAHIFCDRQGQANEGCAVTAYFDKQGDFGGPPTPRNVIGLLEEMITKLKVEVTSQRPLRRGPLEGLQILGREPGGDGAVWIEGLLLNDAIYFLSAWSAKGDPYLEPAYQRFFNSFQIWSEPAE